MKDDNKGSDYSDNENKEKNESDDANGSGNVKANKLNSNDLGNAIEEENENDSVNSDNDTKEGEEDKSDIDLENDENDEDSIDKVKGQVSLRTRIFLFFTSIFATARDGLSNFWIILEGVFTLNPIILARAGWSVFINVLNSATVVSNFFNLFKSEKSAKPKEPKKLGFFGKLFKKIGYVWSRISENILIKPILIFAQSRFLQMAISVGIAIIGMIPPATPLAIAFNSLALGVVAYNVFKGIFDRIKEKNLVKKSTLLRKLNVLRESRQKLLNSKALKNNQVLRSFIEEKVGNLGAAKIDDSPIKTSSATKNKILAKTAILCFVSTFVPFFTILANKVINLVAFTGLTSALLVSTSYTYKKGCITSENETIKDRLKQQNDTIAGDNNINIKEMSISSLEKQFKKEFMEYDALCNVVSNADQSSTKESLEANFEKNKQNSIECEPKRGVLKGIGSTIALVADNVFVPLFTDTILKKELDKIKQETIELRKENNLKILNTKKNTREEEHRMKSLENILDLKNIEQYDVIATPKIPIVRKHSTESMRSN